MKYKGDKIPGCAVVVKMPWGMALAHCELYGNMDDAREWIRRIATDRQKKYKEAGRPNGLRPLKNIQIVLVTITIKPRKPKGKRRGK